MSARTLPAFRVTTGQQVRHARRTWRVQRVDLLAVFARSGEQRGDPRVRLRLSDGKGHHVNLTVGQYDPVRVVTE